MEREPEGTDNEFERLVEEGIKAARAGDDACWRLGDLALKVAERYSREKGKRLQEFADRIHVSYPSLANYRRVAAAFPESSRRSELWWSHHMLVAGRKDADELLARAKAKGWSVRQLARELGKDSGSKGLAVKPPKLPPEDQALAAIDMLQQVVVEARCSPVEAVERLDLLEDRLDQLLQDIFLLQHDTWYGITPEERDHLEEIRADKERAWIEEQVAAMEKINSAPITEDDPERAKMKEQAYQLLVKLSGGNNLD